VTEAAMMLQHALRSFRDAMYAEGIAEEAAGRVINRVVWGEPEGYVASRSIDDAAAEAYVLGLPAGAGDDRAMALVREQMARTGLPDGIGVNRL
jgi:hypothetical protein